MRLDRLAEFRTPDEEAGLWSAEQFVPTEGDDLTTGRDRFLDGGFVGQTPCAQVHQTAAAEIEHDRNAAAPSQADEIRQGDLADEPAYRQVAAVDYQQQRSVRADSAPTFR